MALLAEFKLRLITSSRLLLVLSENSEGSCVRIADRQSPGFLTLPVTVLLCMRRLGPLLSNLLLAAELSKWHTDPDGPMDGTTFSALLVSGPSGISKQHAQRRLFGFPSQT